MKTGNILQNKKALVIIGSISGCFITAICCILILVLGVGRIALVGQQSPEGVIIDIDVPVEVNLGENFEIVLTIENIQAESQNLIAMTIVMDYLIGVNVIDSDPIFLDHQDLEILEIPMKIFTYNEMILENEILIVTLSAETLQLGDFGGEIQICINNPTNCERIPIRTLIID